MVHAGGVGPGPWGPGGPWGPWGALGALGGPWGALGPGPPDLIWVTLFQERYCACEIDAQRHGLPPTHMPLGAL